MTLMALGRRPGNIRLTNASLILAFALITIRLHPVSLSGIVSTYWADGFLALISLAWLLLSKTMLVERRTLQIAASLLLYFAVNALLFVALQSPHTVGVVTTFVRMAYYVLITMVFFDLLQRPPRRRATDWIKPLDLFFFVNVVIVLAQLFDPPYFGDIVRSLFGKAKLRSLATGYPRVYGAFSNANWFSVYLVFNGLAWVAAYKARVISFRSATFRLFLLGGLVLVSGSRTGLVGLVVGLTASLLLTRSQRAFRFIVMSAITIGGLLPIFSGNPLMRGTMQRFMDVFASGRLASVSSVSGRQTTWAEAWRFIIAKPIFGHGDPSLSGSLIPHNSYLTWLLAYGLIGVIPLAMVALYLWTRVGKRRPIDEEQGFVKEWFVSFTVAFGVMSFSADFIITTQVMLLWLFLVALSVNTMSRSVPLRGCKGP